MANKIVREIIHAKGIDIGIYTKDFENEYISLTDIAKYRNNNDPRFVIQNWMRNRNTVEFLAVWEELHNPDFNRVQFEAVRSEAGLNRFVMTPTKWIEQTNAIGIVSKAGRYGGGTYAHSDIAMAFATWISPEFQLYIMKDYRRLKQDENSRFSLDWNLNRALSKVNYRIHTDEVKENLIPPELTPEQIAYTYASEADLLNVALFGQTAKQWKNNNPSKKGNVRDDANLNQLLVLANMESYNATKRDTGLSKNGDTYPYTSAYISDGESYPINQSDSETEKTVDAMDDVNAYIEIIKENIEYDHHMKYGEWQDKALYDELFEVICEVVCVKHKTVRIAGEDYPYELVKSKFLKLNSSHLNYVIGCMKNTTTKITNIKAYMVTTLYNAPSTINHYYQQEVQHDMYGGGWHEKGIV